MNQHEIKLTLALYYEHMQRTGHDCRKVGPGRFAPITNVTCNVCLYLKDLMDAAEAAQCPPEPEAAKAAGVSHEH